MSSTSFERIEEELNVDMLMHPEIDDFDEEEARLAVIKATEEGLVLRQRIREFCLVLLNSITVDIFTNQNRS
jgi:hypothetical protein